MEYFIRSIEITDEAFLWDILYQALYVPLGETPLPRDIIFQPELAKYVKNWKLDHDLGLIATLEESKNSIGAAWLQKFNSSNPGYGYINDHTPELTVAVLPKYRGQGIGTNLLRKLLLQAKSRYSAVSLSVSLDNPAFELYRRFEFEIIRQHNNSLTMKKDF